MNLQEAHVIYGPMYFGLNTGALNLWLLNWQADALPSEWTGIQRARPSFANANIHILVSSFIFQALRWCLLKTWKFSVLGTVHTQLDVQVVEMEQQVIWVYKISKKKKKEFHGILQARILEWVAVPFSRESSWPRDPTQVSRTAGGFFTSWASREVQKIYLTSHQMLTWSKILWI